jgi:hypothetical protein
MSKVPKGISIQRTSTSVTLTTSNYSDSLYLMQVMLFIPFLSILSIVYLFLNPYVLLFSIPAIIGTVRWIHLNRNDNYKIHLYPQQLLITKGLNKKEIINANLQDIIDIYIVKKYEYTIGEFGHAAILDNKNELIIETISGKIVVTNSLVDSEQIYIKNSIWEWIHEHRSTLSAEN